MIRDANVPAGKMLNSQGKFRAIFCQLSFQTPFYKSLLPLTTQINIFPIIQTQKYLFQLINLFIFIFSKKTRAPPLPPPPGLLLVTPSLTISMLDLLDQIFKSITIKVTELGHGQNASPSPMDQGPLEACFWYACTRNMPSFELPLEVLHSYATTFRVIMTFELPPCFAFQWKNSSLISQEPDL